MVQSVELLMTARSSMHQREVSNEILKFYDSSIIELNAMVVNTTP